MLTADTITDHQIRELFHPRQSLAVIIDAVNALSSFVSVSQKREARARCAEILNTRKAT